MKRAIFIIACNYRGNKAVRELNVGRDMIGVGGFFEHVAGYDMVESVEDKPRDAVLAALDKVAGNLGPGDLLLIYFGGHGVGGTEHLLVLPPGPGDAAESAVAFLPVQELRRRTDGRGLVRALILDCCRNDDASAAPVAAAAAEFSRRVNAPGAHASVATRNIALTANPTPGRPLPAGASKGSFAIFCACTQDDVAPELGATGKGLFSTALRNVLHRAHEAHRSVRVDDALRDEVEAEMAVLAKEHKLGPTPQPYKEGNGTPEIMSAVPGSVPTTQVSEREEAHKGPDRSPSAERLSVSGRRTVASSQSAPKARESKRRVTLTLGVLIGLAATAGVAFHLRQQITQTSKVNAVVAPQPSSQPVALPPSLLAVPVSSPPVSAPPMAPLSSPPVVTGRPASAAASMSALPRTPTAPSPPTAPPPPAEVTVGAGAYPTIVAGLKAVCRGGVIHIKAGSYRENLTLDKPVTLCPDPAAGEGAVTLASDTAIPLVVTANDVTVQGLAIHCTAPAALGLHLHAVDVRGGPTVLENCDIGSTSASSLGAYGASAQVKLVNCNITGADDGLLASDNSRVQLEQCHVKGNRLAGLEVRAGAAARVEKSWLTDNGGAGVYVHGGSAAVTHSVLTGNSGGAWPVPPDGQLTASENETPDTIFAARVNETIDSLLQRVDGTFTRDVCRQTADALSKLAAADAKSDLLAKSCDFALGRLPAPDFVKYLTMALPALRQQEVGRLLKLAGDNDTPADGKKALAALDALLSLDRENAAARTMRERIAGYYLFTNPAGKTFTIVVNSLGMQFVQLEPAEFLMGTAKAELSKLSKPVTKEGKPIALPDETQHVVKLTHAFSMARGPVTVAQFRRFVKEKAYLTESHGHKPIFTYDGKSWSKATPRSASWEQPGFTQKDDEPVVCVSWNDARSFCQWLSATEGHYYRLPTEAEWEYAARAGTGSLYPWGNDPDEGKGWCNALDQTAKKMFGPTDVFPWDDSFAYTSPVGSFRCNDFGLYDTIGNVEQWCADYYAPYGELPQVDPIGDRPNKESDRVVRGGSWFGGPAFSRSGHRSLNPGDWSFSNVGFRCVLDLTANGGQ